MMNEITALPMDEDWDGYDAGAAPDSPDGSALLSDDPMERGAKQVLIDPEPDVQARLERVRTAQNPLLEAARPLLRILSEMPEKLPEGFDVMEQFRAMLDREVRTFQTLCDKASLRREHAITARYCLCTAIDEAASSTLWGGNGVWAASSLAQRFHQDVKGGEKFFLLIGRLTATPEEHIDLLEVMYRILGLGFHGIYGATPESRRQLEVVRHRLLTVLNGARGPVEPALSPRWAGEAQGKLKLLRTIPVWTSASILGLILFAVFAWHKFWLLSDAAAVEAEIAQIARLAPPPPKQLRLAELLKDEIAAGRVTVTEGNSRSSVVFRGDDMFLPGQATVSPKVTPTLDRLAAEINKVPGRVIVTGHSDGSPIHTAQFPSNQALSEKRAESVVAYLASRGVEAGRMQAAGKGDAEPLDSNATAAGRARNRRVEILVVQ